MKGRFLLAAALFCAAASGRAGGDDGRFDKTIAFPRSGDAVLNWSYEKCTIRSVEVRNYPSSEDIEKARTKDHDDHSWLWWEFRVDNRGGKDCKVRVWIEILDKSGKVIKDGERSGSVDAGKIDDSLRLSARMRTLDAADAPKVRIRAEIVPK